MTGAQMFFIVATIYVAPHVTGRHAFAVAAMFTILGLISWWAE